LKANIFWKSHGLVHFWRDGEWNMKAKAFGVICVVSLALVGCETVPSAPTSAALNPSAILADPARSDADRANDARRKVAESLQFMQVRPGMTIFDMEAGSGFWSEVLARATGPSGKVIMQNPAAFGGRLNGPIATRLANNRLPNVTSTLSNFDALAAPSNSVDLVTWVQGPHELYFTPPGTPSLGNPTRTFAEIARVLKRGGKFVVIDHSAVAGAPATTGQTLHRIDPAVTIASATAAGLQLDSRADFLANPADPKDKSAFDASIRGRTDQHVLRFVKR
jgi:predicted methyltransferase